MRLENPDAWPFFRQDPDLVVLPPLPGVQPSPLPPVRIFLGTEEAQYRAERIFFYSVEQVRDPARAYEIHLMKNLRGFNRRHWRTGFTNYRYAIPDFAGRVGKAIYNDVDQIYLADPALLFDLDMAGHGYRSIAASDTSVMLIDCAKMWPIWNRAAASTGNKYALLSKPRKIPGLWGQIDAHWNARDQEYVEGRTKCLHYTALHQQPWEPFPEHYSYHPNPLAYIWHDLERRADAGGYEVFTAERPSPTFTARLGGNHAQPERRRAALPSAAARRLMQELGIGHGVEVTASAPPTELGRAAFHLAQVDRLVVRGPEPAWPAERAEAVLVHDLLEHVPPADLGWLLEALFRHATRLVYVAVDTMAFAGLGSADWWQRRVAEVAARHPSISWHVDAVDPQAALRPAGARRLDKPIDARIWTLLTGGPADGAIGRLAASLGGATEPRRLALDGGRRLPNWLVGGSLRGLDIAGSDQLAAPWPDLVISADSRAVPVARWIKERSGGRTKLVHLGPPATTVDAFDLVVARPDERLPIRENILQVAAPLAAGEAPATFLADAADAGGGLAEAPRPWTLLPVTGGLRPFVMGAAETLELGRLAGESAGEGTLLLLPLGGDAVDVAARIAEAAGSSAVCQILPVRPAAGVDALVAGADRVIVTGDDSASLLRACLAGKPVELFELQRWHDRSRVLRPFVKLGGLLTGKGVTYRGTPHQQHAIGRLLDGLAVRGVGLLSDDPSALHRALVGRGLVRRLGAADIVAAPRPLDDLERVRERVRRLLSEVPAGAAS